MLVIPLHGHLAPAAWAAAQARPGPAARLRPERRAGRCPGSLSRDVAELRERGLLCGHVTAGPGLRRRARGDQRGRRRSTPRRGALGLGRDRRGPGPGSSARPRASGTAGWRRSTPRTRRSRSGCRRCCRPRLSSSDPRPRHRGLSHHTASVLELLLAPVRVPVPEAELEGWPLLGRPRRRPGGSPQAALDELIELCEGPPRPRRRAGRPRRLRRERPAGADDGPLDRRGPAVLRRAAGGRAARWPRR